MAEKSLKTDLQQCRKLKLFWGKQPRTLAFGGGEGRGNCAPPYLKFSGYATGLETIGLGTCCKWWSWNTMNWMLITKAYNNDKPAFGGLILYQWKLFTEKCDLTLTAMVSDVTHSRIGAYVLQSESSDKFIKTPYLNEIAMAFDRYARMWLHYKLKQTKNKLNSRLIEGNRRLKMWTY